MRDLIILGSTGSIGSQTLEIVDKFSDKFNIRGLTTYGSIDILSEQVKKYQPRAVTIVDDSAYRQFKEEFGFKRDLKILKGSEGIKDLIGMENYDTVVNSIVGSAGLPPSLEVLERNKRLCLANKEALVIGGELINKKLDEGKGELIPIDSEHSALLQASLSGKREEISKLILTASGGPFWDSDKDFSKISVEEALAHPNWDMGNKISIDSATMMNKGLEVIEAHYLFDIKPENIEVLVHPESIVHSLVEFVDSSQIAQLSKPDMKLAILYALNFPHRVSSDSGKLNLAQGEGLHFHEPDMKKFPCLKYSYQALKKGASFLVVLDSANEAAVKLFLNKEIGFQEIPHIIGEELSKHSKREDMSLGEILELKYATYERVMSVNKSS